MLSVAIGPGLIAAGDVTWGPVDAPEGWFQAILTLDIAALIGADVALEWSADGLVWSPLASATRVVPGPDAWRFGVTQWTGGPAGQIRATLSNDVLFASLGGSLVVS